jgi:transcription antitermination protein NusB
MATHKLSDDMARRRGLARVAAVQALFQWLQGDDAPREVVTQFLRFRSREDGEGGMPADADRSFFQEIVSGASKRGEDYDKTIAENLRDSWTVERIDRLLRAILLAGIYELDRRNDVPARVVITQYVEVAQQFFSGGEPAFVNVTLDRIARRLRAQEFETQASKAATPDAG